MAYRINGIGVWPLKAGYNAGWGADDAVECFTFVWLPLVPGNAIHIIAAKESFGQTQLQSMPIRSSSQLVGQVMLRGWSQFVLVVGVILLIVAAFVQFVPPPPTRAAGKGDTDKTSNLVLLWAATVVVFTLGLAGCVWARRRTTRTRNLRLLLGWHGMGNSDPASWVKETWDQIVTDPQKMFGAATFAQAVQPLLGQGDLRRAMWAARLSAACEDPFQGEVLTDAVLGHPAVPGALEQVRLQMRCRR
jgi:hypothetical protein